jgi:hypothetical protein
MLLIPHGLSPLPRLLNGLFRLEGFEYLPLNDASNIRILFMNS